MISTLANCSKTFRGHQCNNLILNSCRKLKLSRSAKQGEGKGTVYYDSQSGRSFKLNLNSKRINFIVENDSQLINSSHNMRQAADFLDTVSTDIRNMSALRKQINLPYNLSWLAIINGETDLDIALKTPDCNGVYVADDLDLIKKAISRRQWIVQCSFSMQHTNIASKCISAADLGANIILLDYSKSDKAYDEDQLREVVEDLYHTDLEGEPMRERLGLLGSLPCNSFALQELGITRIGCKGGDEGSDIVSFSDALSLAKNYNSSK